MGPTRLRFAIAAVALSALLAGCSGTRAPPVSLEGVPAAELRRAKSNVRVFEAVWSTIADDYYDRTLRGVDWDAAGRKYGPRAAAAADDEALYEVLDEMLDLLGDKHTNAVTPKEAAERDRQTAARIGLAATDLDGRHAVVEVERGGPAEAAGVRIGWILVARNGVPVGERETGPPPQDGKSDDWDFLDEQDRPRRLSIVARTLSTRDEPRVSEARGGVVVLRFDEFDFESQRWFDARVEEHQSAPGLVIDLRGNGGGDLEILVAVTGALFDEATDCGRLFSRGGRRLERSTKPCKTAHYSGPVAVLVDGSTASAAEILAAILQERKRATVVGRKTRGAVLGSGTYSLPDGGELQVSGLDYLTPTGRRLEGVGVVPDVESRLTLADVRSGRDPDLEAALRALGIEGGR